MADSSIVNGYKEIWLQSVAGDSVVFYASPELEESGSTIYISLDDIRAPASIMVWMGSPSRTFTINSKLISRTQKEAQESVRQKNLLQAWRMPQGSGVGISSVPEIISLTGYGNQFKYIPTIVQSLNISYPTDVDYIDSGNGYFVPIVWPISVTLKEFHTQPDMAAFDYEAYKSGELNFWN